MSALDAVQSQRDFAGNAWKDKQRDFWVDLSGCTAVITGASAGIGAAIADIFLKNGAKVIGLQRRKDERVDQNYRSIQLDLANFTALDSVGADIIAEQQVDILVNNAGINIRHQFENFPMSDWDQVIDLNLRAQVRMAQLFGRPMLTRGAGVIVNIASVLSFHGGFTASAYSASKGAIAQFTKSLANEWAGRGVRVNAIAPGFIDTDMNTALRLDGERNRQISERIPADRWGKAEDIAGAALFLVSDAAKYVNGAIVPVDGGYLGR